MKPIYLEFCGINSFSEKTQIDFRALLSGGVFGIFGDTGSGKSTILDCIHLALYGVIERASRSMNDCINYHADSAYVVFDFELTTEGVRRAYRVRRERKRKNGTSKASLWEYTPENTLLALAEGTRDVDAALEKIIGLEFNDFKMCIALPQGDFAALVKAQTSERVKLVSRLFDLEKYGERLSKAANEKYYQAERAVELLKAEMGQNDGGSDEAIAAKTAELATAEAALKALETDLQKAELEYERLNGLKKEKEEYDDVLKKLIAADALLPQMQKKKDEIARLPMAKLVCDKANDIDENTKVKNNALQAAKDAKTLRLTAEEKLAQAKKRLEDGNFDEKILQYTLQIEKLNDAAADIAAAKRAEEKFNACVRDYKELNKRCVAEDFEAKRAKIEEELNSLGEDDTLLDYLKHHFKDVMLAETYGEVRQDLRTLGERYPVAAAEIATLIQKYTFAEPGEGKSVDVAQINVAFKQIEQRKKALKKDLEDLENRKREYDRNESQKSLLAEQGKIYRQNMEDAQAKIAFVKDMGSPDEVKNSLEHCRKDKESALAAVENAQKYAQELFVEEEKQNAVAAQCTERESALNEAFETVKKENGFTSAAEARALIAQLGGEDEARKQCEDFFKAYELCKSRIEQTDKERIESYREETFLAAQNERTQKRAEKDEQNRTVATIVAELKRLEALREKYREYEKELKEKEKRQNLCDEFRSLLKSNKFLEFIASEYLQEICVSASQTLLSLTSGRYFLRYDKEFKVGDNLDGGNLRAVKTLSGGETFLVSLSLALSLSGAICQKSLRPIEFFFLDEGFGTLDEKLVDTVMDVLGKLSKSFAVGLISHVEELKHRIDNKILVTGATETRGSTIRITNL